MSFFADLHMHSTVSDGELTPARLMHYGRERGLDAISLTDHDTMDGVQPAAAAAAEEGLLFVPGIEISSGDTGDIHVLGYGVSPKSDAAQRFFRSLQEERITRAQRMVKRLQDVGMAIDFQHILSGAGCSVGRPHIAKALVAGGYVQDMKEAFDRYLLPGCPGFVPRETPPPEKVVQLILQCGGFPVLAHPGILRMEQEAIIQLIRSLKEHGLMGLQVFYPAHREAAFHPWLEVAQQLELTVTGGSDFHKQNDKDTDHDLPACCAADWPNARHTLNTILDHIGKQTV